MSRRAKSATTGDRSPVVPSSLTGSMAATREHLKQMDAVASKWSKWRPGTEVLTQVKSVPTIFPQLDVMLRVGGWPIERFVLVHGPSSEGKAQPVDELVLTPTGWRQIGDLRVDDVVMAADGMPTRVTGVYPQGKRELYKVCFSDGTSCECCAEHLWLTRTQNERMRGRFVRGPRPERVRIDTGSDGHGSVKSLQEIMDEFEPLQHEVPACGPIQFEPLGELPVDPYVLGLMLGDGGLKGCPMFYKPEPDLHDRLEMLLPGEDRLNRVDAMSSRVVGGELTRHLRSLELMGLRSWEKFVPDLYMRASVEDRTSLVLGLIDTDGSVVKDGGAVEYSTSSFELGRQFTELVRSLGWVASVERRTTQYSYKGEVLKGRPSTRVRVYAPRGVVPVSSEKHLSRWKGRGEREYRKTIKTIVASRVEEAVCIRVEHESHLYVTRDYIVTHNSAMLHGVGKSFLMAGHFYAYVDAEYSTPADWIQTMLNEFAGHPGFRALRPKNYEETVDQVREFCTVIGNAKAHGELDPETSGFVVIDSLRKLVPKDLLAKIIKGSEQEEVNGRRANKRNAKRSVDGAGGRAAMIKAAMNAAWFDEVIPMLAQTGTAMAVVARESENVDAGNWGDDFHVQGGRSPFYESSVVLRIMRDGWVRAGDDKSPIIGERHTIEQRKTKVGTKIASAYVRPRCYFHTSNGALVLAGFDRARDVIELAVDADVVKLSGSWYAYGKKRLGQGANKAVARLASEPDLLGEIEVAARAAATKAQDAQNGGT